MYCVIKNVDTGYFYHNTTNKFRNWCGDSGDDDPGTGLSAAEKIRLEAYGSINWGPIDTATCYKEGRSLKGILSYLSRTCNVIPIPAPKKNRSSKPVKANKVAPIEMESMPEGMTPPYSPKSDQQAKHEYQLYLLSELAKTLSSNINLDEEDTDELI